MHFNVADCPEVLIFYKDKMHNSKNSRVFNFVILVKSRKFDARKICFYSMYNTDMIRNCCGKDGQAVKVLLGVGPFSI